MSPFFVTASARHPTPIARWRRVLAIAVLLLLALALLVVFFPWDLLRGPVNRYVSERTGRHFEITRKLDVKPGRETLVIADGIEFSNPSWARETHLVRAERAEFTLPLWPLIRHRQLELHRVLLSRPHLGLEMLPDGRKTWSLEREGQAGRQLKVGVVKVDQGSLRFIALQHGADIRADFAMDPQPDANAEAMPLSFRGQGTWRGQAFVAQGRTGNVMGLRDSLNHPFAAEVEAQAGDTSLRARGRVGNLARFQAADFDVDLRGRNLADLYHITGIVLPATPTYAVKGHVRREGRRFHATGLQGSLGRTDVSGELVFDTSRTVPLLSGNVRSRVLDFQDLAPLVGMAPPRELGKQQAQARRRLRASGGKVLPDTPLDVSRLNRMDADVRYVAQKVVNVKQPPLERIATHVKLQGGTLDLEPLDLGVAGGSLAGRVRIVSRAKPAQVQLRLDARGLSLEKLLPAVPLNRASVGQVYGRIDLAGQGGSIAQMLASSSGQFALLLGRGRISNLLLEILGLDGGEIIKFLMEHDQVVAVRCGAASFDVKRGLMSTRLFVLDTDDTIIYGDGAINLANETLGMTFRPYPKDRSILALRSPLKLTGTLGAPQGGVDRGRLAARAGAAIALSTINPLLGLASTVETGPGKDADCTRVLNEAARPRAP